MGANVLRGSLGSDSNRPVVDPGTSVRTHSPVMGPTGCDANSLDRAQDVFAAWQLARGRYIAGAILSYTRRDFYEALDGLLPGLLTALGILVTTTGVGAIAGGVFGAGVGTGPGAAAGFAVGMEILNLLGLGFLMVYLSDRVGEVTMRFNGAIRTAWQACGNPQALDHAAREFADAIGLFSSLLMQGIIAFAAKEGFPQAIEKLEKTSAGRRFAGWLREGKWTSHVEVWLERMGNSKAPALVQQRVKVALEFLRNRRFGRDGQRFSQMKESEQLSRLRGMDFHNNVEVQQLRVGDEVIQYQGHISQPGNYFTKVGTSPENLGIESAGRQFVRYRVIRETDALVSTAAEMNYKIGDPSYRGRGVQYLVDNDSRANFEAIQKPGGSRP